MYTNLNLNMDINDIISNINYKTSSSESQTREMKPIDDQEIQEIVPILLSLKDHQPHEYCITNFSFPIDLPNNISMNNVFQTQNLNNDFHKNIFPSSFSAFFNNVHQLTAQSYHKENEIEFLNYEKSPITCQFKRKNKFSTKQIRHQQKEFPKKTDIPKKKNKRNPCACEYHRHRHQKCPIICSMKR
jgi:hypothetical protein